MATWQQMLALDAKYNNYRSPDNPQFRTLYIRRRSQLLRESAADRDSTANCDPDRAHFRKQYLRVRAQLLAQKYGNPLGLTSSTGVPSEIGLNSSLRSRSVSLASHSISRSTFWSPEDGAVSNSEGGLRQTSSATTTLGTAIKDAAAVVPTPLAEASKAMVGGKTLGENYAFAGMHHVFEHHSDAVFRLAFAPDDKHRLGCCSKDGTLSVFDLGAYPPYLNTSLCGHEGPVRNFDWSISGDQLLSVSDDATLRVWDVKSGQALRVVLDPQRLPVLSCAFQPLNNNIVATGNALGYVNVFNVSTGKPCCGSEKIVAISASPAAQVPASGVAAAAMALRKVSLSGDRGPFGSQNSSKGVTSGVTALTFDDAVNPGAILWAGTESGAVVALGFDLKAGKLLPKTKRTVYICSLSSKTTFGAASGPTRHFQFPITSLQTKTWISREARDPTLLANAGPNHLLLFRILSKPLGALQLRRSIPLSTIEFPPTPSSSASLCPSALDLPIRSNFCPLMSFSEGACVISGSLDCGVNFFDVERESSRTSVNCLQGHAAPTLDVAFNFDESLLASCDAMGLVIVWKREKK